MAGPGHVRSCPAVDMVKGQNWYDADVNWGVLNGVHICNLVNTIEPSVCSSNGPYVKLL